MERLFNAETWNEFLERLASYEGSLSSFCKENNMSKSQFYYYKKRFGKQNVPVFHAISLNEEKSVQKTEKINTKAHEEIRIEIGKAKIYIPSNEAALISVILKDLSKSW